LPAHIFAAPNFTVLLDRDSLTLGETVKLTLRFDDAIPTADPVLPAIPDATVGRPTASKQNFFSAQGGSVVRSSTLTYDYDLTPTKAGTLTIPAITQVVGGQSFTSQPLKLKIAEPGKGQNTIGGAFLKLSATKSEVYLGEILPVEIQLYFQNVQNPEMPHLNEEGFLLGKMQQTSQADTVLNGVQYHYVTLDSFVVPAKAGKLDLGPATIQVTVPRSGARDWLGRMVDWQRVTLQSDEQPLNVLPLPRENVPPGFNGAVGSLTMTVTVNPTNVAVGDPITIKIQITGRGELENLTLPAQTNWEHFKVYPPTSDFQPADQLGISGTKNFALTVVAESMDVKELPPYIFSFFDPDQKKYRTLALAATPIIVRPSAASLPPPTIAGTNPSDNPAPTQDIKSIKTRPGTLAEIQPALILKPWFLGMQSLPVLAWLTLLVMRRQKEKLSNNPRLRRQRQVEQTIRTGLKELEQAANANDAETFFATVFRLLQEQLGERLDVPASAITEAVLDERLRPLGVPEEQLDALRELFQVCNQARYGRESTNQELLSLIPKLESAINDLKSIKA
jgi:hypothetical protein